jgi:hypothetical protein
MQLFLDAAAQPVKPVAQEVYTGYGLVLADTSRGSVIAVAARSTELS